MKKAINKPLIVQIYNFIGGGVLLMGAAGCGLCAEEALDRLIEGNKLYMNAIKNPADIAPARREDTAVNGQAPYAVILTCSDSRVPPEHIFSAGIGELFVIRTAGNVVSDFELGSIEYGAGHLGTPLIVVLGHSGCGAVAAALDGHAAGFIQSIVREVQSCVGDTSCAAEAEDRNIRHSAQKILQSGMIGALVSQGTVAVRQAKYDLKTGAVHFFD